MHFAVYYNYIYLPLSGICRTGAGGLGVLLKCSQQRPLLVTFVQGTGAEMAGDSGARAARGLWVMMLVGLQRLPGTKPWCSRVAPLS